VTKIATFILKICPLRYLSGTPPSYLAWTFGSERRQSDPTRPAKQSFLRRLKHKYTSSKTKFPKKITQQSNK